MRAFLEEHRDRLEAEVALAVLVCVSEEDKEADHHLPFVLKSVIEVDKLLVDSVESTTDVAGCMKFLIDSALPPLHFVYILNTIGK